MKSKSVGQNAVLNFIKTFCSIAFPLITFPYVTRVLTAENLGKVNYANSIVQYFVLIAVLGTVTYATRECSSVRDDREKLQKTANEIFGLNIVTFIVSIIALAIVMLCSSFSSYRLLILIYSTQIFFTAFSFEWINSVFEDYAYITIRTIIIQTISLILTFVLVRDSKDYYLYAFIQTTSIGIISIANIVYTKRYLIIRPSFGYPATIVHLRNSLVFFANSLAITVYCNSDITMLGVFKDDVTVGVYSVSAKIYTITKNLLAAVLVVCIPRLSNYFNQRKEEKAQELLDSISKTLILIIIPAACGMIALSSEIIRIVAGEEYIHGAGALSILSVAMIFAILGGIVNNCILIPIKQEKINLISTISAAASNFGLNFILIPILGASGAAITTVIAEMIAFLLSLIVSKEVRLYFRIKQYLRTFFHSLIGGITVFLIVRFLKLCDLKTIYLLAISIIVSLMAYFTELLLFKDDALSFIMQKIKSHFVVEKEKQS